MKKTFHFNLNGKPTGLTTDGNRKLLWVLRTDLGLTGTRYGCGVAQCGACTVLVDKEAVRSCQVAIQDVNGKDVITIEGLSDNGNLHPLQRAFAKHEAMQCGYCTSGMIMNAYGLLLGNPQPTRAQIIEGMDGNLCRCGSYLKIIEAVQAAALEMKGRAQK